MRRDTREDGGGSICYLYLNYVVYTIVMSCVVTADIDSVRGKGAPQGFNNSRINIPVRLTSVMLRVRLTSY